jgi:hypothetical protein
LCLIREVLVRERSRRTETKADCWSCLLCSMVSFNGAAFDKCSKAQISSKPRQAQVTGATGIPYGGQRKQTCNQSSVKQVLACKESPGKLARSERDDGR